MNDLQITSAGLTDIGNVRDHNEDAFAINNDLGLFIVADGVGGEQAGEIASSLIAESLPLFVKKTLQALPPEPDEEEIAAALGRCIQETNRLVHERSSAVPQWQGMASTLVTCLVRGTTACIAHIGDSRAYLLKRKALKRLTTDHSLSHPCHFRNVITRSIGSMEEVSADIACHTIEPGDKILLCSDGLTNALDDNRIGTIMRKEKDPNKACRALVNEANDSGGYDNITVVLISVH